MKYFYVFSILVVLLASCNSSKKVMMKGTQIKYIEVLSGGQSNVGKASNVIINSKKELEEIYATINKNRTPSFIIPVIDFSKETVIALFMGSKSSGGYSTYIKQIEVQSKTISITIEKKYPTGMVISVLTQPFYIAKIPKSNKSIVFIE